MSYQPRMPPQRVPDLESRAPTPHGPRDQANRSRRRSHYFIHVRSYALGGATSKPGELWLRMLLFCLRQIEPSIQSFQHQTRSFPSLERGPKVLRSSSSGCQTSGTRQCQCRGAWRRWSCVGSGGKHAPKGTSRCPQVKPCQICLRPRYIY